MSETDGDIQEHGRGPQPLPLDARRLELAAAMFDALGDPGRLRLMVRLAAGQACVGDLAAAEGEKTGTVSARLKTLLQAGLLTRRRDAKHVFYALADTHVADLVASALDHAGHS